MRNRKRPGRRRICARLALAAAGALAAAPPLHACVDGRALTVGFFDDFKPVSYSAAREGGGRDDHRGYEADLLSALEAMGGMSFVRRAIDTWPGLWLRAAGPEYDLIGGGITIRADRTRDAAGRTVAAFTAGHIAFVHTLLVRAGDAARIAAYGDLTSAMRVAVMPGTTGEERLLQLAGLVDPDGALRTGTRIHLGGGQVLEADGTDRYTIAAAGASANLADRQRLEPPAGAGLPQVVYFRDETAQLGSLRDGTADAVARGLIGNADAAAASGGALVVTARDAAVEYGGFALAVEDAALRACLDERIAYLTDSLRIGYEEWRADPGVFLRRAQRRADAGRDANRSAGARRSILPALAAALPAETFAAVGRRIEDAFSGAAGAGAGAPAADLRSLAAAAAAGRLDGAAFALPFGASGGGALWGAGAYRRISGGGGAAPRWNGGVTTGLLGADARLGPDALAGLAVSRAHGAFDFAGGDYDMRMTSAHPYAGWKPSDDSLLWTSAGYGRGGADIGGAADGRRLSSDLELRSAAFGAENRLFSRPAGDAGGAAALTLKGEAWTSRLESAGAGDALPALTARRHRVRAAVALSLRRPAPGGAWFAPSLEAGALHDGGDGMSGAGADLAAALRYSDPAAGLAAEARGRWLAAHRAGRRAWSAGGSVRLAPGAGGRGLSLGLAPSFASGARLDAEIGYGLRALGGLLTPWSALRVAGGAPEYRLGARLAFAAARVVAVEARRRPAAAETGIALRGDIRF